MKKELIELRVNGRSHELAFEPSKLLLDVLRQDLDLTGSKRGCDDSSCGACTVLDRWYSDDVVHAAGRQL